MITVLCTGVQPALLHTRKLILEKAGHTVVTAQSDAEVAAACRQFKFNVAVIGQAVDGGVKRNWVRLIRWFFPSIKVVEVYGKSVGIALKDADEWLEVPVNPIELVECVAALAGERGLSEK